MMLLPKTRPPPPPPPFKALLPTTEEEEEEKEEEEEEGFRRPRAPPLAHFEEDSKGYADEQLKRILFSRSSIRYDDKNDVYSRSMKMRAFFVL